MRKLIVLLSLVCTSASADEFQTAVGMGHQYGGLIGAQVSYKSDESKYFASLGLVGAAVGFQHSIEPDSHYSYGMVLGSEALRSEDGFIFVNGNYHFNGFNQPGWVFGFGVGATREDSGGFFSNTQGSTETKTAVSLNIGYEF